MISRRNKEHAVPQILRMLYSVNWCRAIEKKSVVHRKISRYLHKTKAIVLATFFLVHWAKFHLSSIDIMKVSLFGYIIYFAASQLIDNIRINEFWQKWWYKEKEFGLIDIVVDGEDGASLWQYLIYLWNRIFFWWNFAISKSLYWNGCHFILYACSPVPFLFTRVSLNHISLITCWNIYYDAHLLEWKVQTKVATATITDNRTML